MIAPQGLIGGWKCVTVWLQRLKAVILSAAASICHTDFSPCAGKREKITITNDKGRLSQEEIDRMVSEAEEFAEADKKVKGRVDARNGLETYCYNMRQTIDDKLGEKLSSDDKKTVWHSHFMSE